MRNQPLSIEQVRHYAPSVFAESAHHSRSERYAYVPTIESLEALMREGFQVYAAGQSKTRKVDMMEHTKHWLRLRHADDVAKPPMVGGVVREIMLKNSHNGSSAAELYLGAHRYVCSNGLLVPLDDGKEVKVYHKGDSRQQSEAFIEAAYEVLGVSDRLESGIDVMNSVQTTEPVRLALADASLAVKYGEETPKITADQVLRPRFHDDTGGSVWNVFNTLQHNIVEHGGIRPRGRGGRATRPIRGIDQNVRVNEALWRLAETVAQQLAA